MAIARLLHRLLIGSGLLIAIATSAGAETRVALVIGNSGYASLPALQNPRNDAADIALALESLDFRVFLGEDLPHTKMSDLVARFVTAALDADVSLFYYAGHGFQVNARNYLVPVDAKLQSPEDVEDQVMSLDSILSGLEDSEGTRLIFLDACRNNPFDALADSESRFPDGLARVGTAAGFLFAYATQPDNVAYDGIGRNSFFTEAMLSHISTPGQDVSELMIAVRKDVIAATGGKQIPWENSSLTRQFAFDPAPASASPETLLWQVAARERDPQLMQLYLDRYPQGAHIGDAWRYLEGAGSSAGSPDPNRADTTRSTDGEAPEAQADKLWQLARRTRMRPLLQFYIEQYPEGDHIADARRLLGTIPAEEDRLPSRLCERLATHPRDATANVPGIPFARLEVNAEAAIEACSAAARAFSALPHYTALLARAYAAAGQRDKAIELYRDAAERGDLRAMVSLGLITETGDGVPQDLQAAMMLYRKAADGGSPDGAINLAVALLNGKGVERDPDAAIALLRKASNAGSAIATYNLGVLAEQGMIGSGGPSAIDYFRKAAREGEPRGYLAAAILLDEGRGVARDPDAAADMLLRGVASDDGDSLNQLTRASENWNNDTIREVQARLGLAGFYDGALDGVSGPKLAAALEVWRNGGFTIDVLGG